MNPKLIFLAVLVVAVAGLTAFLARTLLIQGGEGEADTQQTETVRILVAGKNLPMGHLLEAGDFSWAEWPTTNINPNYLREEDQNPSDLFGNVVRYGIAAGEPVTIGRVIAPGQRGFLAAVLSPGMRAITVPITRITGIAGFIFPGDRVDLILIQNVDGRSAGNPEITGRFDVRVSSHRAGVTVLQNVRVLAVDERTNDQNKVPRIGKSVTLEVTPQLAERVAVAQRMGQLVLSLRSATREQNGEIMVMGPDDDGPYTLPQTLTWDYDVSQLVDPIISPDDLDSVTVSRGNSTQTIILGADGLPEGLSSGEGDEQ